MLRYHFFALFTTLIWGTTFTSSKVLLNHGLTPVEIVSIRFALAYLCMVILMHKRWKSDNWKDELRMIILGLTGGSLYFIAENAALTYSLSSTVCLIVCSTPLVTLMMDAVLHHTRISSTLMLGSMLACAGMVLVICAGNAAFDLHLAGVGLAFCASFCWSIYTLVMRQIANKYPSPFITRKVFFYGFLTLMSFFTLYPLELTTDKLFTLPVVGNLLFLGIVASLGGYLMWNVAIKKLGAIRASNYIYLQPGITALASVPILHEHITMVAIIGMCLTIGGLILAERGERIISRDVKNIKKTI